MFLRFSFFIASFFCIQNSNLLGFQPVWNMRFALNCDVTPFKNELPVNYHTWTSRKYVIPSLYIPENVKEGDIIWLQSSQLPVFVNSLLPKINQSIILCITEGDESFPSAFVNQFDVDSFISNPKILHIFAQNVDFKKPNPKVTGIPIGIDFHTIASVSSCHFFNERCQSVVVQEEKLNDLLSNLLPTHQRKKRVFVDFHLSDRGNLFGESRSSIYKTIESTGLVDSLKTRISRCELWKTKGEYAFSISPHGAGLDCHRTWEDLVLGCIVIVKKSALNPLYEGLPVVIVDDWSLITAENLEKWFEQYGDAFTNPKYRERLTHTYWMNRIRYEQQKYRSSLKCGF